MDALAAQGRLIDRLTAILALHQRDVSAFATYRPSELVAALARRAHRWKEWT